MKNLALTVPLFCILLLRAPCYAQSIRWAHQTEMGLLVGGDPEFNNRNVFNHMGFSIQSFNGIGLGEVAQLGVTVAVDGYPEVTLLPISLGARLALGGTDNSFAYLSLEVGHGFSWLEENSVDRWHKGGLMFHPALGLAFKKQGKDRFTISLGYKLQKARSFEALGFTQFGAQSVDSALPPGVSSMREDSYDFRRFSIRFGVLFW